MSALEPDFECTECGKFGPPHRRGLCNLCYQRARNKVGYKSTYVNATPVRNHVYRLLDEGVRVYVIAKASGIPSSTIDMLLYGRQGRGHPPSRRVSIKTAKALLGVRLEDVPVGHYATRMAGR